MRHSPKTHKVSLDKIYRIRDMFNSYFLTFLNLLTINQYTNNPSRIILRHYTITFFINEVGHPKPIKRKEETEKRHDNSLKHAKLSETIPACFVKQQTNRQDIKQQPSPICGGTHRTLVKKGKSMDVCFISDRI